jgi:hypothetical protein
MKKVVEEFVTDTDYVWIHDYHLLVLPSLLRKSFNKIRCVCWCGGGGGGSLCVPDHVQGDGVFAGVCWAVSDVYVAMHPLRIVTCRR